MAEKRSALIIASYHYEDQDFQQLVAPRQDAEKLTHVLEATAIGGFEVRTLLNKPSYFIRQEIEMFFSGHKRDDLLLLYFSGHGIKDEEGRLYFATTDTKRRLLRSTAVPAVFINEEMQRSGSRRQVLILDCCYSGAFARGMVAKGDKEIRTREAFEGRGRVVLTSSNSMQYAFEGDSLSGEGVQSVFTRVLIKGLETGEADLDGDGHVTLDELYEFVHDQVVEHTPQQRPEKWDLGVQGKIIIARNPNPPKPQIIVPQAEAPPVTPEVLPVTLPKIKLSEFPLKAWKSLAAGTLINLAAGVLYAWSVWAKALINVPMAGQPMKGINAGWIYLTNAQVVTPFSLCIIIFALCMIPGGGVHDKWGPRASAIIGGCFLSLGCVLAGLSKSYGGLVLGFGVMGGIGMGFAYAAAIPSAVRWFGPRLRGFAAGLVVGGYGAAALYISPLARYLVDSGGISHSFIWLGVFFGLLILLGGSQLAWPPADYTPPGSLRLAKGTPLLDKSLAVESRPGEMLRIWQFYLLVFLLICTTEVGLLLIAHGAPILAMAAKSSPFLVANAWILPIFGGLANTAGRIGTGIYSDRMGRVNAYGINGLVCGLCLLLIPGLLETGRIFPLLVCVAAAYWVYGGGLALMPAFAADLFGEKHLGMNYGLIFLGWGLGFFMTRLAGIIKDVTGQMDWAFYLSALAIIIAALMSYLLKRATRDKA